MFVNEWLNVHIKLDVHLTDDSSSDCWLAVKTAREKTEQRAGSFLFCFGEFGHSPLLKMCLCLLVVLETIVPYFVLSIFKAFFFLTDGSRFLIGHR